MTFARCAIALAAALSAIPATVFAGSASLVGEGFLGRSGGAIVDARHRAQPFVERGVFIAVARDVPDAPGRRAGSSLFNGTSSGSFFAPLPPREMARRGYAGRGSGVMPSLGPNASAVEHLRQLIGHAESRADGYDAINYGARRLPGRRPSEMTLGEIYAWIDATPGQPHAIGRYQFIPSTLKRLARQVGAGEHERFSPKLQDVLADQLFAEAGFNAFREGLMGRHQFMNNLAEIWAGLPNSSGRSHYHGFAGNQATMTWAHFDAQMENIFPS